MSALRMQTKALWMYEAKWKKLTPVTESLCMRLCQLVLQNCCQTCFKIYM